MFRFLHPLHAIIATVCFLVWCMFSQKRRLAYKSKRNWLSRVVLKTISNILHHWDYNAFTDRMAQPMAALTNPVVEKSSATVLCLHCFGNNSERFKFCQHCGVAVDSAPLNHTVIPDTPH